MKYTQMYSLVAREIIIFARLTIFPPPHTQPHAMISIWKISLTLTFPRCIFVRKVIEKCICNTVHVFMYFGVYIITHIQYAMAMDV